MGDRPNAPSSLTVRLWIAFAALPFIDAALGFVGFPLVWALGDHTGRPADPDGPAIAFAFLSFLAGVLVTALAVPLVIRLLKRGPLSLAQCALAGLLLGNVPFGLYVVGLVVPMTMVHLAAGTMGDHLMPAAELLAGTMRAMTIGSTMGGVSGVAFWFLGVRGGDDAPVTLS